MISPDHELATWMFAARHALDADGYNADDIMNQAGLNIGSLKGSTQEIPKTLVEQVWEAIEKETSDDAYCLRSLAHLSDPFLNALVTSIQASGSVQSALQLLFKYAQVVHPGMNFALCLKDSLKLKMLPPNDEDVIVTMRDIDIALCLFAKMSSQLLPNHIKPCCVYFKRQPPDNLAGYLSYFNCDVVFCAKENGIEFPKDFLNGSIPGVDPNLSKHLESYLAEQIRQKASAANKDDLVEQVQQSVMRSLSKGTPKIKDISSELGISIRSLQRKLKDHNLSFSDVLNQTRIRLAKSHLVNGAPNSIERVAEQIGFSEPSNFVRFFKQHTGMTPSAFVKQVTVE